MSKTAHDITEAQYISSINNLNEALSDELQQELLNVLRYSYDWGVRELQEELTEAFTKKGNTEGLLMLEAGVKRRWKMPNVKNIVSSIKKKFTH